MCGYRDLRPRHVAALLVIAAVVGLPLSLVQAYLSGPSERVLSLLTPDALALTPDALTLLTMMIFCLTLGLAAGHLLLRSLLTSLAQSTPPFKTQC